MSYANQKVITSKKEVVRPQSVRFTQINDDDLFAALRNLTPGGQKLFFYLCRLIPNTKFELSAVAFMNTFSVSESSYHRAVKELTEKGYLYGSGTRYFFTTHIEEKKNDENEEVVA